MAPSGDPGVPAFGEELGPEVVLAVSFFIAGKRQKNVREKKKKKRRIIPLEVI